MWLWRLFVIWCIQLGAFGTVIQFILWLYEVDEAVRDYLDLHRDWLTIGLACYFVFFLLYALMMADAEKVRRTQRRLERDE